MVSIFFVIARAIKKTAGLPSYPLPHFRASDLERMLDVRPPPNVVIPPPRASTDALTRDQLQKLVPICYVKINETCTICLDDIARSDRVRQVAVCGHFFHSACIRTWLRRNKTCPNCQAQVLDKLPRNRRPGNRRPVQTPSDDRQLSSISSKDFASFGYNELISELQARMNQSGVIV